MFIAITMKVAILYSGGKDSNFALYDAQQKGWDIRYLLSVKPNRTDCFLFHFATVEHTQKLAKMINVRHVLTHCTVADPKLEAEIVRKVVEREEDINALILGGIGLQETQIRSIREALKDLNIEVFASHAGLSEEESMKKMLEAGFKIVITQYATEGLTSEWLGREITFENFEKLKWLSEKYGFNLLGEGGYFDTLVIGSPCFNNKELEIISSHKEIESQFAGHLVVDEAKIVQKAVIT